MTLNVADFVWLGAPNTFDDKKYKAVAFRVWGTGLSALTASDAGGTGDPKPKVYQRDKPYQFHTTYFDVFFSLKPQVDGEWAKLTSSHTNVRLRRIDGQRIG